MLTTFIKDEDTGAMFGGSGIGDGLAVVSLITVPRGDDDVRGAVAAGFFRDWVATASDGVSRIVTWASDRTAAAFMATLGFVDDGAVMPDGARAMHLVL